MVARDCGNSGGGERLVGRLVRPQAPERKQIRRILDPFADKVIVLGVAACFVAVGRYWWLPVALLWVRDVGISVLRVVYAKRGVSVPARLSAKWKTTLQGAALTAAALPPLKTYDELHVVLIWRQWQSRSTQACNI